MKLKEKTILTKLLMTYSTCSACIAVTRATMRIAV